MREIKIAGIIVKTHYVRCFTGYPFYYIEALLRQGKLTLAIVMGFNILRSFIPRRKA